MTLAALLLPLILLAALGYGLAKLPGLKSGWQASLNELTAKLFIPALLFGGMARNGLPPAVTWQFLAAFFLPLLVLFLVLARLQRAPDGALAATYSNTVFVGIPVLTQAFGAASLQYAFPVIAFHGLIAFSLYYLAARTGGKLSGSLVAAAKNPVVLSLMLGLAVNLSGLALPALPAQVLALLSGAALPCALLALGAALASFRVGSWRASLVAVMVKLLVLPAGVLAMAHVLGLAHEVTVVLVILAACPAGVNGAALIQSDGHNPAHASSVILLSTVLCVATLPLWLALLQRLPHGL